MYSWWWIQVNKMLPTLLNISSPFFPSLIKTRSTAKYISMLINILSLLFFFYFTQLLKEAFRQNCTLFIFFSHLIFRWKLWLLIFRIFFVLIFCVGGGVYLFVRFRYGSFAGMCEGKKKVTSNDPFTLPSSPVLSISSLTPPCLPSFTLPSRELSWSLHTTPPLPFFITCIQ